MQECGVKAVHRRADYSQFYDVNVLLLVHYSGIYKHRLHLFKQFGLLNAGKLRVHILIVSSPGDGEFAKEIALGWPQEFEVTVLEMMSRQPLPKINGAYLWLKEQDLKARWLLRVDDDSVTDLTRLLEAQESRFGEIAVHLMSTPDAVNPDDFLTKRIEEYLKHAGLPPCSLANEYEASLTSGAALSRIFASHDACRFLAEMARLYEGPGDKCLAIASRIAGVPTATAIGMYHQPEIDNMSITGGSKTHIHYVDWHNINFIEMLWAIVHGEMNDIPTDLLHSLTGRRLGFGRCVGYRLSEIVLKRDGTIGESRSENETAWSTRNGHLFFSNSSGNLSTVFTHVLRERTKTWLIGPHLLDNRKHYLGPI